MNLKRFLATFMALTFTSTGIAGFAAAPIDIYGTAEEEPEIILPEDSPGASTETSNLPESEIPLLPEPEPEPKPEIKTVTYLKVTGNGVNLRTGAGTDYSVKGVAEKNTLYAYLGTVGGWYKLNYKNSIVYISKKFCTIVEMEISDNQDVEEVIEDGTKYMGVKYVYGAVRYHDGTGKKLKGFTEAEFDCSSLMQYIFYTGAKKILNVNTRTQVKQGVTVSRSQIKRGDLLFFTNASRQYNTGLERIGHVALYLGDNYILHTSSDYAKIEQISSSRWDYFIQAQRMF